MALWNVRISPAPCAPEYSQLRYSRSFLKEKLSGFNYDMGELETHLREHISTMDVRTEVSWVWVQVWVRVWIREVGEGDAHM